MKRKLKGDWIIKGVKGEFYPCKPDIFQQTYEPYVEPSPEPSMPLIECNIRNPELVGFVRLKLDGAKEQRDADMAWLPAHDQQVRTAVIEEW